MNLEYQTIESICIEININNRKWLISGLYRTPSLSDSEFTKDNTKTFDKTTTKYENFLILGDLSYDMLVNEKCIALKEVCDIFDLSNMVVDPTYFTKGASASLNDVILYTNNYNCGISDVHNIISIQMKGNLPSNKKELKCFRSFKNIDQEKFTEDLNKIDFDKITDQNDVNKMYSDFEEAFIQTVDKHAPVKQRKPCQNPASFINKELRKAVYKKDSCIINIINVKLRVTGKIIHNREI